MVRYIGSGPSVIEVLTGPRRPDGRYVWKIEY
jgi:hypothetical protein